LPFSLITNSICKLLYQEKPDLHKKSQKLPDLVTKKSKKVRPSDKKPYLVTRKVNKTDAVPKKLKNPDLITGKAN